MQIIEINTKADFEAQRRTIERVVKKHGIIVYPTDTLNAIGCSPYDRFAVTKLLDIKQRRERSLPVLVSNISVAKRVAVINRAAKILAAKFWPGALTLVLPIADTQILKTVSDNGKIGLRVPRHETARLIADAFGGLVIGTSANISGEKPPTKTNEIIKKLPGVDLIVASKSHLIGRPSTVFDAVSNSIIREGVISKSEIEEALRAEP